MSIYLEFPSIEDYPVYSSASTVADEAALIPASAFNWLLTLEFSAIGPPSAASLDDPGMVAAEDIIC